MKSNILIVFIAIYFCLKAFKYEKVTRIEFVLLPKFALIMALVTVSWSYLSFIIGFFFAIIGFFIGYFQSIKANLVKTPQFDKYNRPIIEIKKNYFYIFGWFFIFLISLILNAVFHGTFSIEEGLSELRKELISDILLFFTFSSNKSWYTWLLLSSSSFSLNYFLNKKDAIFSEAIKKK